MSSDAIKPAEDPQVGNLATPLNSSDFSKAFIRNLPAYRADLSGFRRGLEVGLAHGLIVFFPFYLLGPLRNTDVAQLAGLLSSVGLISILTIALSLYASKMGGKPVSTVTTPNPPEELGTKKGWSEFAGGFFIGGCGSAFFAWFLSSTAYVGQIKDLIGI